MPKPLKVLSSCILLLMAYCSPAQEPPEQLFIRNHVSRLASPTMYGRGYVNGGGDSAARYIKKNFKSFGLLPFDKDSTYFQKHHFPINTFPAEVLLKINGKKLVPGVDYLVHAASPAYYTKKQKLHHIDLAAVKDSVAWQEKKMDIHAGKAYYLENVDTLNKYLKFGLRSFAKTMPASLLIVPTHGKLTWLACTDTVKATILYVEDTVLPKRPKNVSVNIETRYIPAFETRNVMAYMPGTEKPDSFILFTAHYDHLGMMGRDALFPGAHDNASGTSLVLYLASYFSKHPQRYSVAFMLFSGEEAGLLGSKYYVHNPVFPLSNIRFVVNLDMTGNAKDGITVVNAMNNAKEFSLLEKINGEKKYLPVINKREQTQNSDHYHFSEASVPAIFIYGLGAKGFYHDVFDQAKELSFENIDKFAKLLVDFVKEESK